MILVVFRSRLRPASAQAYGLVADEMERLGTAMPGLLSFKTFVAEDGERVTIQEWQSQEHMDAWRTHPDHRQAQALGRSDFYEDFVIYTAENPRLLAFRRQGV